MKYYFKFPINLNIDKILEENINTPVKNKVCLKEKALFIIDSLISSVLASTKEIEYVKQKKYYPLSSSLLEEALYDYKHYLNLLIVAGVIESDDTYKVGAKCKGYCFTDAYNVHDYKTYTVTQYTLIKGLSRQRKKLNSLYLKNTKGYSYLTKWFKTGKLYINTTLAYKWIADDKAAQLKNIDLPITEHFNTESLLSKEEIMININNRAANFKHLVQNIHDGTFAYKFAGEGHRFYSPLTNLKKELRNYLTYNGQQLVNIDISNSQPYFAILLHDINFWQKFKIKNKEERKRINEIIRFLKSSESPTVKGFEDNFDLNSTKNSIISYIQSVTNGTFYQQIESHLKPLFPDKFLTDKDVKSETLRMLYVENKYAHLDFYAPMQQVFKQLFPATYFIFYTLKSIKCESKDNYLPILLQKIESEIMIDTVCKKISQLHPSIPLFTIHDSIVTTVSNQAIVTNIMYQTIKDAVGYAPNLKAEILTPLGAATMPLKANWVSNSTHPLKPRKPVINASTRKSFKIVNKTTGEVFTTIKQASQASGVNYNTCRNMLSGANKNTTPLKYMLQ